MAVDVPAGRPRLVVLRALGLGDLLTVVPALRALAAALPGHHRVLAAPAALGPLAVEHDLVDEVVDVDLRAGGRPAAERALPAVLRDADVAVNLHGRGPQSTRMLARTRPGRLVAFAHPAVPASAGGPAWDEGEHEAARWCRLLAATGIPADPAALDLDVPPDPAVAGATLVHPGAASPARRWPADRFAAVARAERARGRHVVVTGSPDEVGPARRVAEQAGLPDAAVLAGRTDLPRLARIVAGAGRVVCGDSGVAHLATATGTPSVVLFGPTPPAAWGAPADRPWHRALWAGRTGDPHAPAPDPGLLDLGVDDVLAALHTLPARPRPATAAS